MKGLIIVSVLALALCSSIVWALYHDKYACQLAQVRSYSCDGPYCKIHTDIGDRTVYLSPRAGMLMEGVVVTVCRDDKGEIR